MIIIRVLFHLIWCNLVNTHYSLYHSDIDQISPPRFDCLYAYIIESGKENGKRYLQNFYLTPYCRRPDDDEKQEEVLHEIGENIAEIISFNELKKQGVTVEQLLAWFAPIDVAEKYEMHDISSEVFYNCSTPWFGSSCQYKFNHNLSLSFGDIIQVSSVQIGVSKSGTCYRFLAGCNYGLWPMCFDWRQVCDGIIDCTNGEDEQWCDQLEMTQCNNNEYRCYYGGQCIPLIFKKDNPLSIDCLDGSDEQDFLNVPPLLNSHCLYVSTFRCQERIGRYPRSFQCGDGQYMTDTSIPSTVNFCSNQKDKELGRIMLTSMDHIPNMNCRKAFNCALNLHQKIDTGLKPTIDAQSTPPIEDISDEDCEPLSEHCLSEWLVLPARPILHGLFQLVYLTNRSMDKFKDDITPDFVCFDSQQCSRLTANVDSIELINGLTCSDLSNITGNTIIQDFNATTRVFSYARQQCLKMGIDQSCTNSSYFHCDQSMKCIPYHRVQDGNTDCFFWEDELFNTCQWNDSNRFQCPSDSNKCLSSVALGNGYRDCPSGEDEIFSYTQNLVILAPFSHLCDGTPLYELVVSQSIETDETNCDWWPCNNSYSRCDGLWNCLDGTDELNCPDTTCPFNEHKCESIPVGFSYCISLAHLYDKYLDPCDDRYLFREIYFYNETSNISDYYLPWKSVRCLSIDKFCRIDHDLEISLHQEEHCLYPYTRENFRRTATVKLIENKNSLCEFRMWKNSGADVYLTARRFGYYPAISMIPSISKSNPKKKIPSNIDIKFISYCHRGITVLYGLNETQRCLCPPNYFGGQCQWQSQRISLTLQFLWRSTAYSTLIFQAIIMLIDKDGQIAPNHEQIIYVPIRDCNTKYNIYLLYPDRPKSLSNNYSIRIDIYEKNKLNYWASWHLSVPFSFLPVNRIAAQLIIPGGQDNQPCVLPCGQHGKCMRYANKESLFFCRCDQGYSGTYCNTTHKCNCANNSICLDASICICPLYKFGSYCYLKHSICQLSNNPCQNNGFCIPNDDRISLTTFTCLCSEGYSGERCQNKNTRIDIRLDEIIISSSSLVLIHFITAFENAEHERTTLLKKVPFDHKSLTIYVTQPFNILFVEIPNQYYYLAVLREIYIPSEHIYTEIQTKQRCSSITELLNTTLLQYEYLRRVKSYPLVCRQHSQLMCFHDNDLMCICDLDRFSNCFRFNHTETNDCQGYNQCENGGQCFQNNETCPSKLTCICPDCYYGGRCQLSSSGFMFSLDVILGYHIKPNVSLNRQPLIIKISIAISTIMFIAGFISGCLSIVTFRREKSRQVGTGNYLLISSITSILMIIILTMKFWVLVLSQMSLINNRMFIKFNCVSLDFTLKVLLASNEWLNACVAIERMISVLKNIRFDKKKSKDISKWVIIIVFVFVILTHIHDPIHRELIDDLDIDEQRIWCLVQYSSSVNIYNSFITLFHFLIPFSINLISGIWLIISLSRNRAGVQRDQSFQQHLKYQIKKHRHILIAPCLLILLSLPRLIISFISGCMRSARQPWLHLMGYFLSFIPSMLIFIVFVLPSENYKTEFKTIIQEIMGEYRTHL